MLKLYHTVGVGKIQEDCEFYGKDEKICRWDHCASNGAH